MSGVAAILGRECFPLISVVLLLALDGVSQVLARLIDIAAGLLGRTFLAARAEREECKTHDEQSHPWIVRPRGSGLCYRAVVPKDYPASVPAW